jgi:hypothetical protein
MPQGGCKEGEEEGGRGRRKEEGGEREGGGEGGGREKGEGQKENHTVSRFTVFFF